MKLLMGLDLRDFDGGLAHVSAVQGECLYDANLVWNKL